MALNCIGSTPLWFRFDSFGQQPRCGKIPYVNGAGDLVSGCNRLSGFYMVYIAVHFRMLKFRRPDDLGSGYSSSQK